MASLRIEPAYDTPSVILDKQNNQFEIAGKSMPEDVIRFYGPVLEWLKTYETDPLEKTIFNFKLIYFNTASSKLILDILVILVDILENGHEVLIRWYSLDTDEDMKEAGEEYAEMFDLEFEHLIFEI
jgi:hypothetical protein